MKKLKQNKAITLVALVITIIILLILAGVTIVALTGESGILNKIIYAEQENKKAEYTEKINLIIYEKKLENEIEQKQELYIEQIANTIKEQEWAKTVVICNSNFEETNNNAEKQIILINTKDGYEITVKVDSIMLNAEIQSIIKGKAKTYKVTFYANNETDEKYEIEVREGFSTNTILNTYTKQGYEFIGWTTEQDSTEVEYLENIKIENITEDINLYAIWSRTIATITYHGNNQIDTQVVEKRTSTPLKLYTNTGIENTGYIFIGWSETENGEVKYTDGAEIEISEDINLYAIYENDSLTSTLKITRNSSNTNKLTKGTTIQINATSTKTDITSVKLEMIKDNTVVAKIYEDISGGKTKQLTLDGLEEDLINLDKLTIFTDYTCKLTAVTESGVISEQSASLTDYTVGSANDLNILATNVNTGTTYSGETITLVKSITTSSNYIPIGYYDAKSDWSGPYFAGTFEGKKYTITLQSMTTDTKYNSSGIFGMVIGGTINELNTAGENGSAIIHTGGIVGGIKNGKIMNCNNGCKISDLTKNFKGGITGYAINSTISNCINSGSIYGNSSVGGICGWVEQNTQIINCINNVSIKVGGYETIDWTVVGTSYTGSYGIVGGIVGRCDKSIIQNCKNNNQIWSDGFTVNYGALNGGIAGFAYNGSQIKLCQNHATVNYWLGSGTSSNGGALGGIVGFLYNSSIDESFNTGTITSRYINGNYGMDHSGGITGYMISGSLYNCYNKGSIMGYRYVGGIVGHCNAESSSSNNNMYNCYNASNEILGQSTVGTWGGDLRKSVGSDNMTISGYTGVGTSSGCNFSDYYEYTQEEMSTTNTLLNVLNIENGVGKWARSSSINDGYPYLVNNVP